MGCCGERAVNTSTIEQFLGDSIRVVFADTPEQQDHVERALVCAVEMQLAMRDLNLEHLREHLPQVYLGLAFGWGIPMAFAAVQGQVPAVAWWLLIANVFWTIAYDTEYAMVDKNDTQEALEAAGTIAKAENSFIPTMIIMNN